MSPEKPPGDVTAINIPTVWEEPLPPPQPANQVVIMTAPGEVLLTFGFAAPLVVTTADMTPQQRADQAMKLATDGVKATLVNRVVMSDVMAKRLYDLLGQQLVNATQR